MEGWQQSTHFAFSLFSNRLSVMCCWHGWHAHSPIHVQTLYQSCSYAVPSLLAKHSFQHDAPSECISRKSVVYCSSSTMQTSCEVTHTLPDIHQLAASSSSPCIIQLVLDNLLKSPGVRPVPLEIHIQGLDITNLDSRMQAMARPCYSALTNHAGAKPTIVFVPSKRHARQTAVDLWAYASADGKGDKFLQVSLKPCIRSHFAKLPRQSISTLRQ